jgi:hypothetical protein
MAAGGSSEHTLLTPQDTNAITLLNWGRDFAYTAVGRDRGKVLNTISSVVSGGGAGWPFGFGNKFSHQGPGKCNSNLDRVNIVFIDSV